jgi:hypothetical protein
LELSKARVSNAGDGLPACNPCNAGAELLAIKGGLSKLREGDAAVQGEVSELVAQSLIAKREASTFSTVQVKAQTFNSVLFLLSVLVPRDYFPKIAQVLLDIVTEVSISNDGNLAGQHHALADHQP